MIRVVLVLEIVQTIAALTVLGAVAAATLHARGVVGRARGGD